MRLKSKSVGKGMETTQNLEITVKRKIEQKDVSSFNRFCYESFLNGEEQTDTGIMAICFGKLMCLDSQLTYMDMTDDSKVDDVLVQMYYLLSVIEYIIPKEYVVFSRAKEIMGVIPNFYSSFSSLYELNGDSDDRCYWQSLALEVRILKKKVDLIGIENCPLDYENYLLDYISY